MKKIFLKFLITVAIIVGLIVTTVALFINFSPAFGDSPSSESMERIKASNNFNGKVFENLIKTDVQTPDPQNEQSMLGFIYNNFFPPEGKNPSRPLPSKKLTGSRMKNGEFAWLGHSTILMKLDNKVIITDPVFNNASPIPGSVEPFKMEHAPTLRDLPTKIDVVLISHDHYDHLDYKAIRDLNKRVSNFIVPLGVKAHLISWGVADSKIQEMDWYEDTYIDSLHIVFTPSRHFSGRGLSNRFSTLWGSWVIQSDNTNVYFSGDSGYFDEFKKIGNQYGPFDIAFMENGAYNTNWNQIHFMPEESVQASIDLRAKLMFPIHWGKFDLSVHPWDEPIIRATKESEIKEVNLVSPLIGEIFNLENPPNREWWEF